MTVEAPSTVAGEVLPALTNEPSAATAAHQAPGAVTAPAGAQDPQAQTGQATTPLGLPKRQRRDPGQAERHELQMDSSAALRMGVVDTSDPAGTADGLSRIGRLITQRAEDKGDG